MFSCSWSALPILRNICLGLFLLLVVSIPLGAQDANDEKAGVANPAVQLKMVQMDIGGGQTVSTSARNASWFLGKNLGLVMNLKIRGAASESYQPTLDKATAVAKALGIQLPEMPEIDGFAGVWTARDYLTGESEDSVLSRLKKQQSPECGSLMKLATDAMFAGILYSSDLSDPETAESQKQMNAMIVQNIKIGTVGSKFKSTGDAVEAVSGLVNWIESGKPEGQEMTKSVMTFFENVEGLLREELSGIEGETPARPAATDPAVVVASTMVGDPPTPEDVEARQILQAFLTPDADVAALTLALKPTESACQKLLEGDVATRAFKVYSQLFADPEMMLAPNLGQTEIVLRKITTDEFRAGSEKASAFPGGYRQIASSFSPGLTIYEFSFVRPGETSGMRFDGLVKIDGAWYVFPKVWRVLDEQPFGLEIE